MENKTKKNHGNVKNLNYLRSSTKDIFCVSFFTKFYQTQQKLHALNNYDFAHLLCSNMLKEDYSVCVFLQCPQTRRSQRGTPHLLFSLIILGGTTCAFLNERNKVLAAAVMPPRAAFMPPPPSHNPFLYANRLPAPPSRARHFYTIHTSCAA